MKISQALWLSGLLLCSAAQAAGEPESCHEVRLAEVGWSEFNVSNAITGKLSCTLGYCTVS